MLVRVWKPIALAAMETSQTWRIPSSRTGPAGARCSARNSGSGIQNAADTPPHPPRSIHPYITSRPLKNSSRAMPRSPGWDGLNQNRVHASTATPTSVSSLGARRRGDGFVDQPNAVGRLDILRLRIERPVGGVYADGA